MFHLCLAIGAPCPRLLGVRYPQALLIVWLLTPLSLPPSPSPSPLLPSHPLTLSLFLLFIILLPLPLEASGGMDNSTFLYFSYGSNLLKERLQLRNPSATVHCIARLKVRSGFFLKALGFFTREITPPPSLLLPQSFPQDSFPCPECL